MQIGFPKCNLKIVVYALVAIAVWFSILTIIPISFSQPNQETTPQTKEETQQTPEKTSLFSLMFKWENAKKGLCIMYVLTLGGVVLIFIIPERAAFFWVISRPKKGNSEVQNENYYKKKWFLPHLDVETFSTRVTEKINAGDLDGATEMCEKENHPVASVFIAGIESTQQHLNNPGNIDKEKMKTEIEKEMEIEGEIQVGRLEQRIWIIDSIATLAPMFGFLGTIVGLISAFMGWGTAAEAGQQVGIGALAGGMYQAMLTTAGGLLIGIPAMFANILINQRIKELSLIMSDYGNEILKNLMLYVPETSDYGDKVVELKKKIEQALRILEGDEPTSAKKAAAESLGASMLEFSPEDRKPGLDLLLDKLKDASQPAELRYTIASVLSSSYSQFTENEQNRCYKDFEALSEQPGMLGLKVKSFVELERARRILESSEPVSAKQDAVESLGASMLEFPPEYRRSHLDLLLNKLKDSSQPAELRDTIANVLTINYYQFIENEQNRCYKDFEALSNQPGMDTLKRFIEIDQEVEDVADFLKRVESTMEKE